MEAVGAGERVHIHKMPLDRRKSASTAEDGEQGDTCRICRGEGTIEQPLFYPCKCSGSIKFVHQDCLMEWLSHSQKKYCELCKTPFRFTKLYNTSMPASLPLPLFLRQIGLHTVKKSGRWLRYVFVTFVWTCWLPWSIRQIWRGLFWLADGSWISVNELRHASSVANTTSSIATDIGGGEAVGKLQHVSVAQFDPLGWLFNLLTGAPLLRGLLRLFTTKSTASVTSNSGTNITDFGSALHSPFFRQPSLLSNVTSLNSLTKYQVVNNGLVDILEGQLICLSVIAAFILVFLIREWVINQQPILNMPNPEPEVNPAVPAPVPVPVPNNEEIRAPGRRRRGFRRPPDLDAQGGNRVIGVAQRPIAVPRPRRAATEQNITVVQQADQALERPSAPLRSSSLAPGSTSTDSIFDMDPDEEASWHPQDALAVENFESPPLQRGMLDEVVDIRRHIEERVLPVPGDRIGNLQDSLRDVVTTSEDNSASSSESDDHRDDHDHPSRTNFVFGEARTENHTSPAANDAFTFSSPFDTEVPRGSEATDQSDRESGSSWEGLDAQNDANTPTSSDDILGQADILANDDGQGLSEGTDRIEDVELSEVPDADDTTIPQTILGRIAQWMWHTDEQVRSQNQGLNQDSNPVAGNAQDQDRMPADGNADAANAIRAPANPPAHEPNVQFGIDLNDPNALEDAEDLEGILELIGMEGPLAGMIQNIIFSVFLITLTLAASVWCPYIWGKIAILIMSNPIGVFFKAPLFFISRCGNVLVDLLLFVGGLIGYGLSNLTKLIKVILVPILPGLAARVKITAVENWTFGVSQNSGIRLERALSGTLFGLRPDLPTFSMQSHHALQIFRRAFADAITAVRKDLLDTLGSAARSWQSQGLLGLPSFLLGEIVSFPTAVLQAVQRIHAWWQRLAVDLRMPPLSEITDHEISLVEWTTEDKVLAVMIGYAFFAAAGFAYLKIAHVLLGLKKNEKVDGMFADSLRQAGGVLKVIIIIGIEMIAFPLYCGLLLDFALLPLFRDATVQSRLEFLISAPVTCLFIHWFVGTCYMFHFALFVSMCRKIMRKGVLYFIRDPDDPTFHPVRDVLERPVATQLGKIAFSACIYGGLVIICLGGVVWTIATINGILPINWATNEPRLAFPVDIIFYNFMLPFVLKRTEPSKRISTLYEWWFRVCAKKLRLSHFLFNQESDNEKQASRFFWSSDPNETDGISAILDEGQRRDQDNLSRNRHWDGRYVRVPAADSVRIPKGTNVFVEVDENNDRIDGEPDRDTGMHGKKDDRFVKIYIPPHFRARISAFGFLVWLFAASTGVAFTVVPLLIGRRLIYLTTASTSAPNDLYAFTVGMHVCGAITFAGYLGISRRERLRARTSDLLTNTRQSLPRLYEAAKHILGLMYLFTAVFVILPFTTSLLTELYIHMPLFSHFTNGLQTSHPTRITTSSNPSVPVNPTIFVLQTWTLGLLYLRLALRLAINHSEGQNSPSTALRAIVRNGYLYPDVALASRALVFPALTLGIILLAAPIGLAKLVIVITGTTDANEKLQLYRHSYPLVLGMALSAYAAIGIQNKIEGWRIRVRDEVYLVGERLHNFSEPENNKGKKKKRSDKMVVQKGIAINADVENESTDTRIVTETD